ncbi:MAG: alpha-2-macroglobulin family protein [Oligoflexia bacterium]|nr:alpha-2-macroglobulin family protein [Oligoflexia bacterium]
MEVATGVDGGDVSFKLPEFARSGGYSLQVQYKQASYLSAFRVANYVKPHFEVEIGFGKPDYKVNEPIKGKVKLTYTNGDPVKASNVEVEIRKQKLTIVEGELQYLDRFPVQVSKTPYVANDSGIVDFDIPPVAEPSRYVISIRAVDGGSYRVSSTKELLVQTGSTPLLLTSEKNFSAPKDKVTFRVDAAKAVAEGPRRSLASWEAVRLQDQSKTSGSLKESQSEFSVSFEKPGSYTVTVKDNDGITLASANHWVQGPELASVPGTVSILLDKNEYEPGDTASALITFSEDIGEALVTFERDKVEKYSLVSDSGDWIKLKKVSAREFKGDIPIKESFNPNITLSVAYVTNGHYFFENKGIKVSTPKVLVTFKPDKETYQPGEKVNVSVETTFRGKPVDATLSVGVVDEMIYVLQPEIAPDIADFFFHPRRNQVRTSSSLSFHSYDAAVSATGATPSATTQYGERSLKLRERPRREEKDTAFWEPTLKTDASGKASFSFVMPDSLTRWRITGRALASNGFVGQRRDTIVSQKDVYLKWTGPTSFRKGDQAQVSVAVFNLTDRDESVAFEATGVGAPNNQMLTLHPGSNYLSLPLKAERDGDVSLVVMDGGRTLDQLAVKLAVSPLEWVTTQTLKVSPSSLDVPPGAFNLRLNSALGANESFFRAVDYLVDYPYGCVEQTSSRLLPLALVFPSIQQMGTSEVVREKLQNRLIYERLRLVKMAGPEASFSWWGDQTSQSAFMTAYAYYADWTATRALGMRLPQEHREHVLEVYKKLGEAEPLLNRVIILWMASEMGLPIKTLAQGVLEAANSASKGDSPLFEGDPTGGNAALFILLEVASKKAGTALPGDLAARVSEAKKRAIESKSPLASSAYLLGKESTGMTAEDRAIAENVLNGLAIEVPTIERGLALAFLHRALGPALRPGPSDSSLALGQGWAKTDSKLGRVTWQYRGSAPLKGLPESILQSGSSFHLIYDSYKREISSLPVKIERKLSKLVQKEKPLEFELAPIAGEWALDSKEIYLDEITISPQGNDIFQFGLLEAALPPGGEVEQTTWGMIVKGADGSPIQIGVSSFQPGDKAYSAAIEKLDKPVTIRHLVRFSQSGSFEIPPTRFFRMYSPAQKGFEGGNGSATRKITVR